MRKAKKGSRAKRPAKKRASAVPSVAAQLPPPTAQQIQQAKKKYEQGILARSEAVESGEPMKPGTTHEIVGRAPDGSPILKRNRFSAR